MDLSVTREEERQFLRRLEDLCSAAKNGGPRFSSFLNERQVMLAQGLLRREGEEAALLYGGYDGAVRCVFGAFGRLEAKAEDFPLTALTIRLPRDAAVTHRDVLGSVLSLKIKRESVGDILVGERRCDVFALSSVAPVILGELKKIGGAGVRCEPWDGQPPERIERFERLRGTVGSPRIDAAVSMLTGLSREKSSGMLQAELVQLNYAVCDRISDHVAAGDIITIRGYGKYIVDEIGSPTRKGRLPLVCRKYV